MGLSWRAALRWAAALGGLGVLLGAFGAHALKDSLAPEMLAVWHTAVLYQFLHALALLGTGLALQRSPDCRAWRRAGAAFVLGCLLFSGSLYLLAVSGWRWLGAITPLGGLSFLLGWFWLWRGISPPRY